jgi:hypothetical protein
MAERSTLHLNFGNKSKMKDTRWESIATAPAQLETRADYVAEISRLWRESQAYFLAIGQYLNEAKITLLHGEFEVMIERDLPFSPSMARKLRAVAELAKHDSEVTQLLPPAVTVLYEVASLNPAERQQAVAEGLIRSNVKREEIVAFKRRLRASTALPDRRAELEAKRDRLRRELEEVERALSELQEPVS